MSPQELASKHPRLYHVTRPFALNGIKGQGLLSTSSILNLYEIPTGQKAVLESVIRPISVDISHPTFGNARLSDNFSLINAVEGDCLDQELSPEEWLRFLNKRVFFWVNEKDVDCYLRTSIKHGDGRIVLIFDTLSVAESYLEKMELSATYTGTVFRNAEHHGIKDFVPATRYSYRDWQKLRGKNDQLKEVAIVDGIRNVRTHCTGFYIFPHLSSQNHLNDFKWPF